MRPPHLGIPLYLSVDVGTKSARAALFTATGSKLCHAVHPIKIRNTLENHYEQSSEDIWAAICSCVRSVCQEVLPEDIEKTYVAAIGIDATCSLVACTDDHAFSPLSVVEGDDGHVDGLVWDVLLWLDRRAIGEAQAINSSSDPAVQAVRSCFGDRISPENEPPKLLWLKKHKPHVVQDGLFFDLADWIAFKCCGNPHLRSSCTVACKWGWGSTTDKNNNGEWSQPFWEVLGLSQLCDDNFHKIGRSIVAPGKSLGKLSPAIAEELSLTTECIVASPMIDAHAGCLWALGDNFPFLRDVAPKVEQRLSVVCGTSTCFIELSREPLFIKGVWGPFRDAVLAGCYITEGGQSVTGELLEYTVKSHPAYNGLCKRVGQSRVFDHLSELTESMVQNGARDPAEHVHCLDYHAGNRSPRADPTLKGALVGMSLATDELDLAVKFRATLQALCYGARHIIEEMRKGGHDIRVLTACGGLCKSKLFIQELADCVSLPVLQSSEVDTVLLGGAILARAAHRNNDECKIIQTISEMAAAGDTVLPNDERKSYHDRKYKVYLQLHSDFLNYREIMESHDVRDSERSA